MFHGPPAEQVSVFHELVAYLFGNESIERDP
jgi:hypothetical protein